jgi:catechol 2,3-dioxygenase
MIKLLSHLSHIHLAAPDLDASVRFYEEQMGLREIHRDGDTAYLRNWGDYYQYSLVISSGPEPAMISMAWRTSSAEALEAAAKAIEAAGVTGTWKDSTFGHGRSYTFVGPWGHTMELFWEVDMYVADEEHASTYPDRPERRSRNSVAPRQIDHITIAAPDVRAFGDWYSRVFGFRIMANTVLQEGGFSVFTVLTTNETSHDLGVVLDASSRPGRINHYAFWVPQREDLLQAADILGENGTPIEYGPSIHGIGEAEFLYFRDPSGMRVEYTTATYRNYVPDWKAKDWLPQQGSANLYRNSQMPMSMTESFPPDSAISATEEGILPGTEDELLLNPYSVPGRG